MSLLYMLLYIPFGFIANIAIDYSIQLSFFIGVLWTMLGTWIRILINYNFAFALIGQLCNSIG